MLSDDVLRWWLKYEKYERQECALQTWIGRKDGRCLNKRAGHSVIEFGRQRLIRARLYNKCIHVKTDIAETNIDIEIPLQSNNKKAESLRMRKTLSGKGALGMFVLRVS